jgi:hypothetical protein
LEDEVDLHGLSDGGHIHDSPRNIAIPAVTSEFGLFFCKKLTFSPKLLKQMGGSEIVKVSAVSSPISFSNIKICMIKKVRVT